MSMQLKKSKEEVLSEIHARCYGHVQYQLNSDLNNILRLENTYSGNPSIGLNTQQMSTAIANAIARGIQESMKVLLENQYTQDDLERDLTLRP